VAAICVLSRGGPGAGDRDRRGNARWLRTAPRGVQDVDSRPVRARAEGGVARVRPDPAVKAVPAVKADLWARAGRAASGRRAARARPRAATERPARTEFLVRVRHPDSREAGAGRPVPPPVHAVHARHPVRRQGSRAALVQAARPLHGPARGRHRPVRADPAEQPGPRQRRDRPGRAARPARAGRPRPAQDGRLARAAYGRGPAPARRDPRHDRRNGPPPAPPPDPPPDSPTDPPPDPPTDPPGDRPTVPGDPVRRRRSSGLPPARPSPTRSAVRNWTVGCVPSSPAWAPSRRLWWPVTW